MHPVASLGSQSAGAGDPNGPGRGESRSRRTRTNCCTSTVYKRRVAICIVKIARPTLRQPTTRRYGGDGSALAVPSPRCVIGIPQHGEPLITWEFPRLCQGGSRSLTYKAVGHPGNLRWLTHDNACGAARPSIKLRRSTGSANTVRCVHSRSLGLDILARRCHHGNCSAFRSLVLGPYHRPLQAALSGSLI
jgi:hypothetical protein